MATVSGLTDELVLTIVVVVAAATAAVVVVVVVATKIRMTLNQI